MKKDPPPFLSWEPAPPAAVGNQVKSHVNHRNEEDDAFKIPHHDQISPSAERLDWASSMIAPAPEIRMIMTVPITHAKYHGPSHEEFHVNGHFHCEIIFSSPCFGSMV
ncbi:hypothetical protein SXCC_02850 [Gluconacetobacter sp. SXCC-1]|nr:hypothetical protein SXCC_02850 [Gluconacetobacter sp. SXCC-1]